ncbi:hypothetical protein VRRI112168_18630 [Vreelandella rituensis]|uniref:Uncharacterized protein n=1 Tax=Vreelandella rituensis TaxID=2282306 RepID=A0A368TNQ0_9GAMM|nr:hypothetical protein [Halomonas rituensis]RCV85936.1 hypothetical protein DU506_19600 [Halomonas rituensis]
MKKVDAGSSPLNPHGPLQRFCDTHYAAQQQELDDLPFDMVSIDSLREGHAAILVYASEVVAEYENADLLTAVATLVLLNSTGPTEQDAIVEAFGNEVAALVAAATTPFDYNCGDAILWESSLKQLAAAPPDAQRVRLALLIGQVEHSPEATVHIPFWHREAEAMYHGDPTLQRRVINRLESAWAKAP